MAAVERMLERGSFKAGPASRCAGCPFAGLCTPCRPQTVKGESGSGQVLAFKELLSLPKLPSVINPNFIDFGSARQGSGGPPIGTRIETSEKNCSECNKPASSCTCRR